MSATPIPRTMHMAVSGVRDTSLIITPPPERRPIQTILQPMEDEVVKESIQFELDRKGQVRHTLLLHVMPRGPDLSDIEKNLNVTLKVTFCVFFRALARTSVAHRQ